jgi:magnesium-transporting ATPase (P-type)
MRQPPRPAHVGLLSWATLWRALAVGGAGLLAVLAVQVGVRAAGWSDEWSRAAALASVVLTNLAMLVWFRVGTRSLRRHAGNRAFAWLLAALAVACGLVVSIAPLTRQFGLPVDVALQAAGLALIATACVSVLASLRARRRIAVS